MVVAKSTVFHFGWIRKLILHVFSEKIWNFWSVQNFHNFCVSHVWASKFLLETIVWCIKSKTYAWYECLSSGHEQNYFSFDGIEMMDVTCRSFHFCWIRKLILPLFFKKIKNFQIAKIVIIFVCNVSGNKKFVWNNTLMYQTSIFLWWCLNFANSKKTNKFLLILPNNFFDHYVYKKVTLIYKKTKFFICGFINCSFKGNFV